MNQTKAELITENKKLKRIINFDQRTIEKLQEEVSELKKGLAGLEICNKFIKKKITKCRNFLKYVAVVKYPNISSPDWGRYIVIKKKGLTDEERIVVNAYYILS